MTIEERKELFKMLEPLLNDKKHEIMQDDCEIDNLGEGMKIMKKSICGWWKPIILVDCKNKTAMMFMNPEDETLMNVPDEAIDWESLKGQDCIDRVKARDAHFPTNIRGFHNGTAEVEWQVSPDGMYYMDDDGFGMTDDEEVSLIGRIDREGRIVKWFSLNR